MMKKLTEWSYREIFIDENNEDFIIKKLKDNREKKYFWIKIFFSQQIYTLLKFWISDFNKYEIMILERVQKIIPNNVPDSSELTNIWLKQSIIKDYDWKISKNLKNFEFEIPDSFIIEINQLIEILLDSWIEPMDIWNNIIIQEYSKWAFKPMLFDFKRIGYKTYPFQPWLFFSKKLRKEKVLRRLDRVLKK